MSSSTVLIDTLNSEIADGTLFGGLTWLGAITIIFLTCVFIVIVTFIIASKKQEVLDKYCSCGAKNLPEGIYCWKCGRGLE